MPNSTETKKPQSTINQDDEETFSQWSAKQLKIQEEVRLRQPNIETMVDGLFPNKKLEQQYEKMAFNRQKSVDQLDEQEKEEAEQEFYRARRDKEKLIDTIAHQTEIVSQDLPEYIAALRDLSSSMLPAQSELTPADMRQWVEVCDTADQAKFNQTLASQWKAKFMSEIDESTAQERLKDFKTVLVNISNSGKYLHSTPKSPEEFINFFNGIAEFYEYHYLVTSQRAQDKLDKNFMSVTKSFWLSFNNPDQLKLMLQIYKEVADYADRNIGAQFAETVFSYTRNHDLTAEKSRGLIDRLLPAMQNNDPQIEIILKSGNFWGMNHGDFGVGDYLCHAYASPVSAENLNELLLAARVVPATSLARLEQNRSDGLMMAKPFGILRDCIHDQRPYINELITAMVHYYDTNDKSQLEQAIPKVNYFNSAERIQLLFDKEKYDMEIEERNASRKKVKPIDVLRRLAENTKPVSDFPPTTSDKELNQQLQTLEQAKINGVLSNKEVLANAINYLNQELSTMMEEKVIGIEPNHIMAISWLERQATELLRNISFEDQWGAYKQDWFISLLKFHELIGSPQYNEQEFQNYIQSLISANSPLEAYKLIGRRILENIKALAALYKKKGRTDLGALWSGNLTHELVGLIDLKPATTKFGQNLRAETAQQNIEPGYHPGD